MKPPDYWKGSDNLDGEDIYSAKSLADFLTRELSSEIDSFCEANGFNKDNVAQLANYYLYIISLLYLCRQVDYMESSKEYDVEEIAEMLNVWITMVMAMIKTKL